MNDRSKPYMLAPGEGELWWSVDGALTTVKATGGQTSGRYTIIEDLAPRGEGTPLHSHKDDDETFYVLEGTLIFHLGENGPFRAATGAFVHIPGGTSHAFRVDSETARYLIITTPRHGQFYQAISEPAESRELPPSVPMDMEKVLVACEQFGVDILGPPPGMDE